MVGAVGKTGMGWRGGSLRGAAVVVAGSGARFGGGDGGGEGIGTSSSTAGADAEREGTYIGSCWVPPATEGRNGFIYEPQN